MTNRILIEGGMVADGTGAPLLRADIAIVDDRVVAVEPGLSADPADIILPAAGRVVAPGFVDIHSHYDAQVFWDPTLASSCHHGTTTVVNGNCGFSLAPLAAEHRPIILEMLRDLEDMRLDTLSVGVPEAFPTFAGFLDSVEAAQPLLNFAAFVGHTTVRVAAMGREAFERQATADEVDLMRTHVDAALAAGACGFATKTLPGTRPSASQFAAASETEALLDVLAQRNQGVAMFNPGGVFDHERVYAAQPGNGRPFTWIAMLAMPDGRHHAWADLHASLWGRADVHPQVSCRPLVGQCILLLPSVFRAACITELAGVDVDVRMRAYGDGAWRQRLRDELAVERTIQLRWDRLVIAESPSSPHVVGRDVASAGAAAGLDPVDLLFDVAIADGGRTRVTLAYGNDDPDEVARMLLIDGTVLGLSDAGAHPDQLCDAILPTDLLGGWVRDRGALSIERAVRKLSGEPAELFGLAGRGRLAPGALADVVVFDPSTVAPGPVRRLHDFPAGADHLVADGPVGMDHVLVNGVPIRRDGVSMADSLH
ncbi:MAG: N-acyl-D-aspartate/D-glutamate deacylase, partial [Acidimicrobiales bacterium]|nr:N-acyl-D-aspartate/D-glutamate deacylase [Acidimicrobiales bacterium]